jgi:NTP pyrophosphatase (non-canonical NTP hydrolase)
LEDEDTPVSLDIDSILRDAVDTWGKESQVWMVVEELGELLQALGKLARRPNSPEVIEHVCEEIADAKLMLRQAEYMFDKEGYVERYTRMKVARLKERLRDAKIGKESHMRPLNKVPDGFFG